MAKKKRKIIRKISQKRFEQILHQILNASDEELGLYTNRIQPSLRAAAEAFHLDPRSEWHREILVRILARLMFGQGKRGRPSKSVKWGWHRAADLGMHFDDLKQERNPT
jgi:hypothetical protein